MFGSWLYCSKNIHCSTCARAYRSSGRYSVPSAKYTRIASDSASGRPSSSTSVGTRSPGFRSPSTSCRSDRSTTSTSRRSYSTPSSENSNRTLKQFPEIGLS